jgi:phosphoglycolate phosphatase
MNELSFLMIFDLDGTLVDSNSQIATNLNRARSELLYDELDQDFYFKNIGLPVETLIADLNLENTQRQVLISRFREHLIRDIRSGNNLLFPGAVELLGHLSDSGVEIAVATNKPTNIAKSVISHSKLSYFKIHVQGSDNLSPKPDPEIIQAVLREFPNRKALMVGDRLEDIVAANSAGISSIGIASGAHTEEDFEVSDAFMTYQNLNSFSEYVCKDLNFLLETIP